MALPAPPCRPECHRNCQACKSTQRRRIWREYRVSTSAQHSATPAGTVKRAFDIALSLIGLVFLSPLLVVLAIWIKLDSPGAVFYRGVRGGRFGTPFRIFK